jgi:UrcA family protein
MSKNLVRLATLAIVASGIALMGPTASAQSDVPQRVVKFNDLDPDRSADAKKLYAKLRLAARAVCAEQLPGREVRVEMERRECFRDVLADAVAKVDSSTLTAVHESRDEIKLAAGKSARDPRT